jgi:hypothetical protein
MLLMMVNLIYLACGDPAILNIGVMIDPASSD